MALTGVDPFDPIPSDRREFIFAAGQSASGGGDRLVLFFGNKTSSGTETTNVIGTQILSDADAQSRMGLRSELYNMYKKYVPVDSDATMYFIAVPEGGGATAAAVVFTFATTATGTSQVEISWGGEKVYASISSGDTVTVIGDAVAAAVNSASEGTWPFTAANVAGAVTLTCANVGPRGDLVLGSTSSTGVRMRILDSVATTVTKGALTAGATDDDFTTAFGQMALGEYYYQVSPKHSLVAVTATDNGIGEHIDTIKTQALPANGKTQVAIFGHVGTQSQATTVATSSGANSVYARFFRQKNSDWTPGMLAAHHAAVMRSQEIAHPSANFNSYASTDSTVYQVPSFFSNADVPSNSEIRACLNAGVSIITQTPLGSPYLVRHVTSRSLNSVGNNDYRAREGHITSAVDFFWRTVLARWVTQRQPFVDADPPLGQKPKARTSTPGQLRLIIFSVIDDLTSSKPLGIYDGPILAPSKADEMKKRTLVTLGAPGKISAATEIFAVQHLIGTETAVRETSPAY